MSFDTPSFLAALGGNIPLILFALFHYGKRRRALARFPGSSPFGSGEKELIFRYGLSVLGFLLCYSCLIIALAGPRWGTALVPEFYRGTDVVLAMDLSRSMEVRDLESRAGRGGLKSGSRIEEALRIGRTLASASGGGRFAVAIGKGTGVLAIPLTEDTEAVLTFLEGLSPASITGRGTNLESLLDAALGAFQDSFPARRRIILFSDGESLSGSLTQGADQAVKAQVIISAVGMGTETGGPVPGASVVSFLNVHALRSMAERTGGLYLEGNREDTAARLIEQVRGVSSESVSASFRREAKSQAHCFILAALGGLGIAKLSGKRRKHEI